MGGYSRLCGLVAALAVSLSSPAKAEQSLNTSLPVVQGKSESRKLRFLDDLTSIISATTSTAGNTLFAIKEAEHDDLEPVTDLSADLLLGHHSGGTTDVRFELPAGINYQLIEKRFELVDDAGNPLCLYHTTHKKLYCSYYDQANNKFWFLLWPNLSPKYKDFLRNFMINIEIPNGEGYIGFNYVTDAFKKEFPSIAREGAAILQKLWNDVYTVIKQREVEAGLTFADFFHELLPQYTKDGIVTPDELLEIQKTSKERVEKYYGELDDRERKEIDEAVNDFVKEFNKGRSKYYSINLFNLFNLSPSDPFAGIKYGELLLRDWFEMFANFKPLYKLTLDQNSFHLTSDVYSRLLASGDWFNQYDYKTHSFREGFLSATKSLGEAHLRLEGEVHGGRLVRDFFDEQYAEDFDKFELLIGYQPVMIDGTLKGSLNGFVDFETLHIFGYENRMKEGTHQWGLGLIQGYVYRLHSEGSAILNAAANSFDDRIEGYFYGELVIEEQLGLQSGLYLFSQQELKKGWYAAATGFVLENLQVLEKLWTANLKFHYDYDQKGRYSISKGVNVGLYPRSAATPLASFQGGINLNPLSPFFFLNTEGLGGGALLNTPLLLSHLEIGTKGYLSIDALVAVDGENNMKAAEKHHIKVQQTVDSPFPAKGALLQKAHQQFYSSLTGLFVETSFNKKSAEAFPHEVPAVIRIGLMAREPGSLYQRIGFIRSLDKRLEGIYANMGNELFETYFSWQQETIEERNSHSSRLDLSANLSLDRFQLMLTTFLYPPAIRYLDPSLPGEKRGDMGLFLRLEGQL